MSHAGRKFTVKNRGNGRKNGKPVVGSSSGGLWSSTLLNGGLEHPLEYALAGRMPGFWSAWAAPAVMPVTAVAATAVETSRRRMENLFISVFPCVIEVGGCCHPDAAAALAKSLCPPLPAARS